MKRSILVFALMLVMSLILFPMEGKAQMGRGMMCQGMMPMMGMAGFERMGIERALKEEVPELKEVVAV